jgi:hypothetical protein
MKRFLLEPVEDLASCLEVQVLGAPNRLVAIVLVLVCGAACWFVYVPVHELLHVAGCEVTGGDVYELQMLPRYGGALLARVFPFVVSGGEYAGRVTGFDTKGSDLIYLATDLGPFVLSVFIGVPFIKACTRRRRVWLLGPALIVGLAPVYNLPGDYYEMGSVVTTRVATVVTGDWYPPAYEAVRSDDVFRLIESMTESSEEFELAEGESPAVAGVLVGISSVVGIFLALATYAAGAAFARTRRGGGGVGPDSTA